MKFDDLWPTLVIPGEFDAMDLCDQRRWRGVIEQAFEAGKAAQQADVAELSERTAEIAEPQTNSFVQPVPYKCDRITWRGRYFYLPLDAAQRQAQQAPLTDEQI